ncbi:MAG: hypothetical protein IPK91_15800 [Saprospiraceae bacterium]|nr:hypothetical protein [Saprospiraceae bacterium]MBK8298707.1 hypothetical protein [Saprospiraceae bacterium]
MNNLKHSELFRKFFLGFMILFLGIFSLYGQQMPIMKMDASTAKQENMKDGQHLK